MLAHRATVAVLLPLVLVFAGCDAIGTTTVEQDQERAQEAADATSVARATSTAEAVAAPTKTAQAEADYVATQVAPADGGPALVKPSAGKPPGARETAVAAIDAVASGPAAGPTSPTQGGCSGPADIPTTLHIVFRGVEPGETFEGEITQPPPNGLSGDATFETTAGPDGIARADIAIKGGGSIAWVGYTTGGFINGYFFAFRNCTGPPP